MTMPMNVPTLLSMGFGLMILAGCGPTDPQTEIDLAPFKRMARRQECATGTNRLFLIDDALVLWTWSGHCADAGYGAVLFGASPGEVLCQWGDSIAGPRKTCVAERYAAMFETVLRHLGRPDLGLGPRHDVRAIRP